MSRLRLHAEHHLVDRIGWLRAAMLGANDGIWCTSPLAVIWISSSHRPIQRMLDPGSFPCSSRFFSKLSRPFPGTRKSPTAAGIRATGLGFGERNVPAICSPNGHLSPKLESRPFYSTSFFSGLTSFADRKVGIPFARRIPRWLLPTAVDTAPTLHNQQYRPS
jgi:hypothetical protein